MTMRSVQHRRSKRLRKQVPIRIFFAAFFFLAVAAFAAGYFWRANSSRLFLAALPQETGPFAPERRQALDLIDEAMRAKHEKRTSGALAALDQARKADPSAPGIDIAFAELALGEKQLTDMRAAAEAARRKNDHAAAASVLLGLDKWINRGASDREMSSAADAASVYFADATDTDYFAAPPWFFSAEVLRYAGRESEGRDRALSALHRFQPWDSSDFLSAKVIFASAEAGETVFAGLGFLPDSPFARAASGFATAQNAGISTDPASLTESASQLTLRALASDPLHRNSGWWPAKVLLLPR
jgi:hypothetical protein